MHINGIINLLIGLEILNKMRGIKRLIYKALETELNSTFILVLSTKQTTSHLVVVPKKKEIRINEEYLKSHRNALGAIVSKACDLLFNDTERVHYFVFEE